MKSLGTYGQGKSYIQFKWEGYAVKFKAVDRTQLALIIRYFRNAQLNVRRSNGFIKNYYAARDLSFEYIAAMNPDCKIRTYQKNKKSEPYIKEYKFNWRIKGYVTTRQLQRTMKRRSD